MGKKALDVLCSLVIIFLCFYSFTLLGFQKILMILVRDAQSAVEWLNDYRERKLMS